MEKSRYVKIYEKQAAFYRERKNALRALVLINRGATVLIFLLYALTLTLALCREKLPFFSWRFLKLIALPFACLLLVSLLRKLVKRKRPYEGDGIVPLLTKSNVGDSFPSRHIASAFVISAVSLVVCLPLGIGGFFLGLVLVYTRFTCGLHYPSDLLCGGAIGLAVGLLAIL